METFFHHDPRIREWVDQITEKVFTVCVLNGVDSDAEFQSGCQIVMKIVLLLQGITSIPSEFLEDGVKQLLEQQLPDTRVINNFPTFQATMDRMLREGILKAVDSQNKEVIIRLASSEENTEGNIELHDNITGRHVEEFDEEFVIESVIPALAAVAEEEVEVESVTVTVTELEAGAVKPEPLKRFLSNFFPNATVNWNKNLMGQTFLAQVEDILICLHDPENPCNLKKFNKDGWKVLVCSTEDLTFPRRLERGIRQIQRTSKMSSIV